MTVGQVNMGSTTAANANNYNFSKRSDANFSEAFTGKPDSLVVWIKYTPVTATDQARISATIHDDYDYRDPEDANATPHVVAKAELDYGKTNGWKRLSIPFIYSGQATTPAYILITFTTNKTPGGGKANDEVLIDDLEMIYNVPTVAIAPTAVQNILEGQNGTQLTATETNGTVTSREWKYSTTSGSGYVSFAPTQTGATYTPNFATQGTYYVVCVSDFGGAIKTSNEVQINVTAVAVPAVSIAPTTVQNILEGQNGTQLTATETNGTVTSREWKYSTTSGSGYVSFAPTQTGATYTPNFATQGTYYVVCVSDFGGAIKTSNEVKINVTKDVSVYNAVASNIAVFGFDKVVTVDLTNVDVENATISILDMAGKKIATSALTSKSVNTINLPSTTANGVYMYQIEGKGVIKTGKLAF
ncbi:MAG TPA: T9SS type A sorting domain-containing protein [Crocinitomicaceae bacterium]|nr:T9SS type A sorting domain-containing protein [Crocinitomicaceae bacterium]